MNDGDKSRLAAIVQSSPDSIIGVTDQGIITSWNPAAETMYGYSAEETIGKHVSGLAIAGEKELGYLNTVVNRGRSVIRFRTKHRRKDDREIDVSISVSPLRDESDHIIGASIFGRDITEQIATEEQLLQAQKMDAIGQLAAGIAHDFNNVITIIKAYCHLLKEYSQNAMQVEHYAELTCDALDRAARVTSQLLAFSRKQPQQLQKMELNEIISGLRDLLAHAISENIELVLNLNSTGKVYVDSGQIGQVLMNLVINARDAMPTGGRLTIETCDVILNEASARAHGASILSGRYQMLAVTDTGVGMDEITSAKIFEPFFTTKRGGQRSGLGLATVYGIAKQHQGYIWAYSEVGKGTCMKLYLPQVADVTVQNRQQTAPQLLIAGGSETVLLVEDQEALREVVERYLKGLGYDVVVADDGIKAAHVIRTSDRNVDVLVTDMIMPGASGTDVARFGRQRFPHIKVIYMSGYSENRPKGEESWKSVFLEKPFDLPTLARTIRELMEQEAV